MYMVIARIAFSLLIAAVGKVPPEQWAKLGPIVAGFLASLKDKVAPGNPLIVKLDAYVAPVRMLTPDPPACD